MPHGSLNCSYKNVNIDTHGEVYWEGLWICTRHFQSCVIGNWNKFYGVENFWLCSGFVRAGLIDLKVTFYLVMWPDAWHMLISWLGETPIPAKKSVGNNQTKQIAIAPSKLKQRSQTRYKMSPLKGGYIPSLNEPNNVTGNLHVTSAAWLQVQGYMQIPTGFLVGQNFNRGVYLPL